nr:hypothetical protein [Bradyrhizobium lablabi]
MLREAFVVQLAAWLDRLTLRRIIAVLPIPILAWAYTHNVPIPPTLMLVGDLLAYIDIFAIIFLLSVVSRVENLAFILKQTASYLVRLGHRLSAGMKRPDFRNRREGGTQRRRDTERAGSADDDPAAIHGLAWA